MGEFYPGFAPEESDYKIFAELEEQFDPAVTPFGAEELTWLDTGTEPMAYKKGTPTGTVNSTTNKTDSGNDDSGDE